MEEIKSTQGTLAKSRASLTPASPELAFHNPSGLAGQTRRRLLERICEFGATASYKGGQLLFAQGWSPRGIYLLTEGHAKLSIVSPNGKGIMLGFCGPGTILGLAAAISRRSYETSAQAAVPTTVVILSPNAFLRLAQENTETACEVSHLLAEERFSLLDRLGAIALSESATQRLAAFLLRLRGDDGARIRLTGITQDDLAQMVGLSRETVSRLLSRLKRRRTLDWKQSMLVIHDWRALQELAAPSDKEAKSGRRGNSPLHC